MKQKTTKLFVLPPPSAKLLLLLELSDLGDSRSILVDFMEVVSMKKLLLSLVLLSSVGLAQAQASGISPAECEESEPGCLQSMKKKSPNSPSEEPASPALNN